MSLDQSRYDTNAAFVKACVNTLKDNRNDPTELAKILVQSGSILLLQTESFTEFLEKYIPQTLGAFDSTTNEGQRQCIEYATVLLNFFNILPQMNLPPIMPFKTEKDDQDYNHFQEASIKGIELLLSSKESPFNAKRLSKDKHLALTLARVQSQLISLYLQRLHGDKSKNLNKAVEMAQSALKVLNPESSLKEYVQVTSLVGVAYKKNAQLCKDEQERESYYKKSLESYESIINSQTIRMNDPQTWAATNNNLANTYLEMAGSSSQALFDILNPSNNDEVKDFSTRIELIDKATLRFVESSKLFDKDTQELQWSTMEYNLGYAHLLMANQLFIGAIVNHSSPQINLLNLIPGAVQAANDAFKQALTVIKPNAQRGAEWARLQIFSAEANLYDLLLRQSLTPAERLQGLQNVDKMLTDACKLFSPVTGPMWYARAQYHLASIYDMLYHQCAQEEKEDRLQLMYKCADHYRNVDIVYENSLKNNPQVHVSSKLISTLKDQLDILDGELEGYQHNE
ncbi:wecC [Acrasis kona]|uniref:WecC n=1 Tax=Acrasis kona TaxID=1008807 RepID=A0AAW2Z4P7_9EUKA